MFITYYSDNDLLLSIPISTTLMQEEYVDKIKWGSAADPNMLAMHLMDETVQAFLAGAAGQELKAKRNTMSMVINRHKKLCFKLRMACFCMKKLDPIGLHSKVLLKLQIVLKQVQTACQWQCSIGPWENIDNIKTFGPCYYVVGTMIP